MVNKMLSFLNKTLHVTTEDGRTITGKLIVYDKFMNLVLSDVKESRAVPKTNTRVERSLGLILLRGETIVSLRAEEGKLGDQGLPAAAGTSKKVPVKRSREEE